VLASAPSAIVTATLEDALAVEERPNMPGTSWASAPAAGRWPNWSLALPEPLERLIEAPLPRRVASALAARKTAVSETRE
jgi:4-alpha-glucanotransferase